LEAIDHIEVLKGPASALYGSEAVGGVVQIFTRTGKTGFHPYATVTAGENERTELATGFSGGTPAIGYSLGVQTLREKGFSATNRRIAASTFNADADGYSQNSVNGSVKWKFANDWTLDARALQSDGVSQSDSGPSAFDVHSDTTTSVYGLGLEGRVSQSWKTRLSLGNSTDKNAYYTSVNPSRFKTEQNQSAWQNDFATPLGVLLVGVENLVQSVSGTQAYKVTSRTNDSVFVGLNGESGAHSWQFNVRGDQNSQFGHADTWLTGYGYRLTPALRIHGSVGTSFNVPSFNQLYWVSAKPTDYQGNPTTQPESGRNTELGAAYAIGDQQVSLTYFANRIQGFITTQPVVLNIPFARIEGWTLAYEGSTHGWSYRAALDTLDARNELTQLKLTRRPDLQFTSSVLYATGPWELGASLLTVSEAFDNTANTTTLGGYGTVDLSVRYAVNKDWSVAGRVVNLGDKFYQTATGYNQPGRSAYVTLQYTPK
jgi:vitamin B12 transporter